MITLLLLCVVFCTVRGAVETGAEILAAAETIGRAAVDMLGRRAARKRRA